MRVFRTRRARGTAAGRLGIVLGALTAAVAAVAVVPGVASAHGAASHAAATAAVTHRPHFIQNTTVDDAAHLQSLGYTVLDVGPGESADLPAGMQGMEWTGGAICDSDGIMSWADFRALVDSNRNSSKVFGYFIFDEPDTHGCTNIASKLRDRADYIHCSGWRNSFWDSAKQHPKVDNAGNCLDASGNIIPRKTSQKAYLVDEYSHDYAAVAKSITHVDLFGLDPYPCNKDGSTTCDMSQVDDAAATAKQYYAESELAPVYQVFGGDGWKIPSATQLQNLLAEWDRVLPGAGADVVYSYRDNKNGGPEDTYPGLSHATNLEPILSAHNAAT
ncbi:hypothetical protein OG417_22180 [Actinoallomurus sp. NBC_01490]|uniref:hypothetical protein n=1 Tax=Actinoallomurus sp. NBC_01490 TaxID=2903557 RepID=UPI002E3388F0|nr:hypothetical protein [Actinoallomurus sp. NBC_01490]